jgi:hypothetical protein
LLIDEYVQLKSDKFVEWCKAFYSLKSTQTKCSHSIYKDWVRNEPKWPTHINTFPPVATASKHSLKACVNITHQQDDDLVLQITRSVEGNDTLKLSGTHSNAHGSPE